MPFVVKKGSKTRAFTSGLIPAPVSPMETETESPDSSAERVIFPPCGIASTALKIMLMRTSRNSDSSPMMKALVLMRDSNLMCTLAASAESFQRGRVISMMSKSN